MTRIFFCELHLFDLKKVLQNICLFHFIFGVILKYFYLFIDIYIALFVCKDAIQNILEKNNLLLREFLSHDFPWIWLIKRSHPMRTFEDKRIWMPKKVMREDSTLLYTQYWIPRYTFGRSLLDFFFFFIFFFFEGLYF